MVNDEEEEESEKRSGRSVAFFYYRNFTSRTDLCHRNLVFLIPFFRISFSESDCPGRFRRRMADDEEEEESERRSGRSVAFFIIGILPTEPASAFSMVKPVPPGH